MDGKLQNKTQRTRDYSQNWRYRQQTGINTRIWTIGTPSLVNPDYSLPPRWAFNVITRRDRVRWNIRAFSCASERRCWGSRSASRHCATTRYDFHFGDQFNRAGGASPRGRILALHHRVVAEVSA